MCSGQVAAKLSIPAKEADDLDIDRLEDFSSHQNISRCVEQLKLSSPVDSAFGNVIWEEMGPTLLSSLTKFLERKLHADHYNLIYSPDNDGKHNRNGNENEGTQTAYSPEALKSNMSSSGKLLKHNYKDG